jgi:hypothetical protein
MEIKRDDPSMGMNLISTRANIVRKFVVLDKLRKPGRMSMIGKYQKELSCLWKARTTRNRNSVAF